MKPENESVVGFLDTGYEFDYSKLTVGDFYVMVDFAENGTARGFINTINMLNRITNINVLDLKMDRIVLLVEQFVEGNREFFERIKDKAQ